MAKRVERKNNNRPTNNAKKQKNPKAKGTMHVLWQNHAHMELNIQKTCDEN